LQKLELSFSRIGWLAYGYRRWNCRGFLDGWLDLGLGWNRLRNRFFRLDLSGEPVEKLPEIVDFLLSIHSSLPECGATQLHALGRRQSPGILG
jgi:hypothetical protein